MSKEIKGKRVRVKKSNLTGRLTGKFRKGSKFPSKVKQGEQFLPDVIEIELDNGTIIEASPKNIELETK